MNTDFPFKQSVEISPGLAADLCEILKERANEIAMYRERNKDLPLSVAEALSRELIRLRKMGEAMKEGT